MLEKVSIYDHSKGIEIEAYTDGYSHDEYGNLFLISILGHDSAVKGVSSAVVSIKEVIIEKPEEWLRLSAIRGDKYRIMSARLESGLLHQIVAMDALFKKENSNKHLIYVGESGDVNGAIFNEIKTSFGTPMLSEWKTWLIGQIQQDEKVEIMKGNAQLVRLNLNENYLDSIVGTAVKEKRIRF